MKISRKEAIKIFCQATNKDDPYWDNLVEEHYDEKKDDWPTIYDVLEPLGVTRAEIDEA
jgi:hypothetical protein